MVDDTLRIGPPLLCQRRAVGAQLKPLLARFFVDVDNERDPLVGPRLGDLVPDDVIDLGLGWW